jgi:hypothetical protein
MSDSRRSPHFVFCFVFLFAVGFYILYSNSHGKSTINQKSFHASHHSYSEYNTKSFSESISPVSIKA